ncbi:MAG: sensor histidine kinase, partial [Rhodovulum sp.]
LKTPLQVIRGTLDRLPDADDAAERAEIAAQIDRVIDQANARVTSLMQLFRLEALAEIPMADRLDLGVIADGAVEDLADLLETRGRTVRIDLAPGVRVSGNRALLDLMVSNLLTNAQKYAPDGAAISVALERRGAAFRLSVANTGSSFPADIRARAFERFARARADADRPGSGIGLSLVRAIVERHGFSVEIPEIEGQAVVVIEGPCAPAREGEQS